MSCQKSGVHGPGGRKDVLESRTWWEYFYGTVRYGMFIKENSMYVELAVCRWGED